MCFEVQNKLCKYYFEYVSIQQTKNKKYFSFTTLMPSSTKKYILLKSRGHGTLVSGYTFIYPYGIPVIPLPNHYRLHLQDPWLLVGERGVPSQIRHCKFSSSCLLHSFFPSFQLKKTIGS